MSYLLEALKKQEAEENPDAAVALSLVTQRQRRQRRLSLLLWAALTVNVCVLAALLLWPGGLSRWLGESAAQLTAAGSGNDAAPEAAPAGARAAAPAAAAEATGSAMAAAEPTPTSASADGAATVPAAAVATTDAPAAAKPTVPQPAISPAQAKPETARIDTTPVSLDALPASVRARFPGIVFSTHIYADDRDLRAVVANGRRLSEGDRLGEVGVSEITETGVILTFEDYQIAVPVVGFWDTP